MEKYKPARHADHQNEIHRLAAEFIQMDEQKQQQGWKLAARSSLMVQLAKSVGAPIDVLLWAFRTRKASFEHDKVYALLSLADNSVQSLQTTGSQLNPSTLNLARHSSRGSRQPHFPWIILDLHIRRNTRNPTNFPRGCRTGTRLQITSNSLATTTPGYRHFVPMTISSTAYHGSLRTYSL